MKSVTALRADVCLMLSDEQKCTLMPFTLTERKKQFKKQVLKNSCIAFLRTCGYIFGFNRVCVIMPEWTYAERKIFVPIYDYADYLLR